MIACQETGVKSVKAAQKIEEKFSFSEIGNSKIKTATFPNAWPVQIYNDSPPISAQDSIFEVQLNNLDYSYGLRGKKSAIKTYQTDILGKKNQKIDSLFVLDSLTNGNISFVYVKSFRTVLDPNYDFPPTIEDIDIIIYNKAKFKKKINIYSTENYPFFVTLNLGYLSKNGNLYMKYFEFDEEKIVFKKETHQLISENGNVKLISERNN